MDVQAFVETQQRRPLRRQIGRPETVQDEERIHTTDCSGDHEVMAKQVRPGLAKPEGDTAQQVRLRDREPTSESHQGPRRKPHPKSECTGAIFTVAAL